MFGYVRVSAPDLRVRENEYYKALYCGLCRTMGKQTGIRSRMTLSYDFVFMAALRMALTGEKPVLEKRRCPAHPFKKRVSVKPNGSLAVCADASAILAGLKCLDDIGDERGFRRFAARSRFRFLRRGFRRASARYPDAVAETKTVLAELSELEAEGVPSADRPASLCGRMTAGIFAIGLSGNEKCIAREIGYHVGRWIYLIDALDDWYEDRRRGRYNPLICLYPDAEAGREDVVENLRLAMLGELTDASAALDLLDLREREDLHGILYNILRKGMPETADAVCARCGGPKKAEDAGKSENEGGAENDRSL